MNPVVAQIMEARLQRVTLAPLLNEVHFAAKVRSSLDALRIQRVLHDLTLTFGTEASGRWIVISPQEAFEVVDRHITIG